MPQNPNYIPEKLSDLGPWSLNFTTLITANPTDYGLVSGDATNIDDVVQPFLTALSLSTNPATRTPVTVNDTQTAKAAMLAVVRPYAVAISQNPAISGGLKTGVGVTDRITTKTRNSIVAASIIHTVQYDAGGIAQIVSGDPSTPLTKKRPLGAIAWEIQVRGKNSGDAGWTAITGITATRPIQPLDPGTFAVQFEMYEIRMRWVGAVLAGGAPNLGPWSAWTSIEL